MYIYPKKTDKSEGPERDGKSSLEVLSSERVPSTHSLNWNGNERCIHLYFSGSRNSSVSSIQLQTFRLHKKAGTSSAAKLPDSQNGLSSLELISSLSRYWIHEVADVDFTTIPIRNVLKRSQFVNVECRVDVYSQ